MQTKIANGHYVRKLLKLFFPIIFGQLAQTSMSVVDTIMAGAAGTVELSGVAIGASFFNPALFALIGLTLAIQPVIAQLRGSGRRDLISQRMQSAFIVCMSCAVLMALALCFVHLLYEFIPADPDMIRVATGYLYATAAGIPGIIFFNILRSYCEGLGNTMPTLFFGFICLALNIPLNYIFIFGKFGAPALGGIGCGVATSLTLYIAALLLFIYLKVARFNHDCRILSKYYDFSFEECRNFFRLALPLALSSAIEIACFSIAALILSPFGPIVVAAHSIAINVSGLFFMVPMSLAMAATIKVGEYIGAGNWERTEAFTKSAYKVNFVLYALSFTVMILFCHEIAELYSGDNQVIDLAAGLLILCSVYMLPDSIQMMSIGILRGFKDSKTIFIVSLFAYWVIGTPLGYLLSWGALGLPQLKAQGIWIGFIFGLTTSAVIYVVRIIKLFRSRKLPKGMKLKI